MLASRKLIVTAFLMFAASSARAQTTDGELQWVNGEWERYWRVLQVGGDVAEHPWSSRPFGPEELVQLRATGDHPWADRIMEKPFRFGRIEGATTPFDAQTIFNSAFPYGFNEGPVWAGRGLTSVMRGGAALAVGPLSASFAPMLFQAQNTRFELIPNGRDGRFAYAVAGPRGEGARHYHDANDLPTVFAPGWGFCAAGDPAWRATIAFAWSAANEGYFAGPFGGLGSLHTPRPWTLGDLQEIVVSRVTADPDREARARARLAKVETWDGLLAEAYDERTGAVAARHWFAWPAAFRALLERDPMLTAP